MAKFRKKPVEIEAVRYLGGTDRDGYFFAEMQPGWLAAAFAKGWGEEGAIKRHLDGRLLIATLEGDMTVSPGDYVIQGVKGELYPCKPDVFAATYEAAA